jgi:hypothetical protein
MPIGDRQVLQETPPLIDVTGIRKSALYGEHNDGYPLVGFIALGVAQLEF